MLILMVALHCEAKPFIDAYKLKKFSSKPFDYYRSSEGAQPQVDLVVSGIGALAMASAVGWVGALRTNQDCAWLNIGTSGHASRELGELVLIHGVGDEVQQRSHYPSLVAKWSGQTDAVLSVSTPSDDYPEGAAVDMEAYAFFNSALRFSDSELVQSLKVVSDNRLSGIEELNAAKLTRYMSSNCLEVIAFAKSLISLIRPKYSIAYDTQSLFELRGTHSQRLQVTQLLQKLQVMNCVNSIDDELTQCKDLSGVLTCLKKALTAAMPSLPIDKADGDL